MYIKNKEINDWLESRTWLFFYGRTRIDSAIYYPIEKDYVKDCSSDEEHGFPYYCNNGVADTRTVYLEYARSNCYTWAFPRVVLKIWGDEKENQNNRYWLEVYFCYGRGEIHYEKVLDVYIKDIEGLLHALRLAGIHESYLTGDQSFPE